MSTAAKSLTADVWAATSLRLGEGPRWIDEHLYLVDILDGRLYRTSGYDRGPVELVCQTAGVPLGGVAPIEHHVGELWLAGAGQGIGVLDNTGAIRWLAQPEPASRRMNDVAADPLGRFWAGSVAFDNRPGGGSLYRFDPDGEVVPVVRDVTVANGPAFSADGAVMFLADSPRGVIHRYTVTDSGGVRGGEVFVQLTHGSPDGMTVDVEGGLWVALWGAGRVHRYRPDGSLDHVVRVAADQPTAVCLGGPRMDRLFITSATYALEDPTPEDGAIFAVDVDVPGTAARTATRPA